MKKINLFLLLALSFLAGANLHAQVTIGSSEIPREGAILDLNRSGKGGLLLSNVSLNYPDTIPPSFPGVPDAETTALNAGLRGALIYNTNPDLCTGIHVWNGNFWERIASEPPVQAQGVTLSITSGLINSLGGDEIGFTAAAGANVYRWYASAGNDYEYIGITTTNTFSKKFPPGDNKVKVIMDDCQSLKESNEVSFNAAALSPGFGGSGGGNIIYIYGNFPYASSSDYVPGLVAHYDGINNQGLGDKLHSGDAIEWKDLSGNSYDVKLRIGHSGATFQNATDATSVSDCAGAEWKSNGFLFNGYGYFANVPVNPQAENALSDIMPNLPFGNDNYTVESVFDPSQISGTSNGGFVGWGSNPTTGDNGTSNCTRFYSATATQMQFRHYWYHNDVDVRFTDIASNNIRNFAVTYNNSTEVSPDNRTFYYNGSTNSIDYTGINCGSTTNNCREKTNKHTATCGSFFIGQTIALNTYDRCWPATTPTPYADYANGNKIFSIRVYNKQLTPQEIAANYEVDRRRFTAPPTVTIGGQACSEVVVLSENFLMCKVPAGSPGTQDVVVVSDGVISIYNNAYEYVGSTAFYINTIAPIVGTANQPNQTLTLTGNNLSGISKVEVGGVECADLSVSATDCTCTLPDTLPVGEVDIMITVGGDVYRFAKVFEYQ